MGECEVPLSIRDLTIGVMVGLVIGLVLGYAITRPNNSKLEQQIDQLESRVKDLQDQLESKDNQISDLQSQFSILQDQVDELQSQLKLLNAPVSSFTTINDLKITIATHKHVYSYKEPVSGNVTVYYLNGTAFKGSFVIYIELLGDGMTSGMTFPVEGYGEFHVKTPTFRFGPGKYRIGILVLYDAEGFIIENRINLFPYVEVEAK